jgi:hypothetical protein
MLNLIHVNLPRLKELELNSFFFKLTIYDLNHNYIFEMYFQI